MFRFLKSLQMFSRVVTQLAYPPAVYKVSFFPTSSPIFVVGGVFDDGYSNRVRWNLSAVLVCISFMARDGEYFSCVFWPFEFLLLRLFCLVHLPISLLVL
jgi:hypothetical protein